MKYMLSIIFLLLITNPAYSENLYCSTEVEIGDFFNNTYGKKANVTITVDMNKVEIDETIQVSFKGLGGKGPHPVIVTKLMSQTHDTDYYNIVAAIKTNFLEFTIRVYYDEDGKVTSADIAGLEGHFALVRDGHNLVTGAVYKQVDKKTECDAWELIHF